MEMKRCVRCQVKRDPRAFPLGNLPYVCAYCLQAERRDRIAGQTNIFDEKVCLDGTNGNEVAIRRDHNGKWVNYARKGGPNIEDST